MEVPDFDLPAELHAGLFVCSHNKDVLETAEFDNVRIVLPSKADFQACREYIGSHIETVDVTTGQRKVSSGDASYGSLVCTVPVGGGKPKQITPTGPSYLHGWSPDGKWLTYTAQRNNDYDIYKIKSTGGKEIRLTSAPGLDDGSEYSPDGKYIYFNSVRSGKMQLWRMKPDRRGPHRFEPRPAAGFQRHHGRRGAGPVHFRGTVRRHFHRAGI